MVLPCEEIEESLTNFVGFHILCFQFFALFIRHTPQIPAACAQAVIRSNPRNLKKLQDCKITYFTLICITSKEFSDHGTKKQTFDPHALTREVVSATHEVVTVPFRLRTYRVIRKSSSSSSQYRSSMSSSQMSSTRRKCTASCAKIRSWSSNTGSFRTRSARSSVNWTKYTTATTSFTGLCSRPTP